MQYETIQIPIKKTSSAYYARLRMGLEEPVRHCAYCGARLYRRYSEHNGRWEEWSCFLRRSCCNNECAQRLRSSATKAERDRVKMDGYKPCQGYDGLYVNREGEFIYNGRKKRVLRYTDRYGRKHTAQIRLMRNGRSVSLIASRLVAQAFYLRGYSDDLYITYQDGDIHHIGIDNLRMVSKQEYERMRTKHASQFRRQGTYAYQVSRLTVSIESNEAVLHYFRTGDMERVNAHVRSYLYDCLCRFALDSLHFGMEQAPVMAADAIGSWYEVLLSGHAVGHGERYCKHILTHFKHHGWYGYKGEIPKNKIELIIDNLKLDSLWERYKVTHLKK